MPVDDTHCHPLGDKDAHTTVDGFIERIALSAFPGPAYFPEGVYVKYMLKEHYIARVETITDELFEQDLPYAELRDRFVARVRDALDGTGNFGKRSVGMKSYLLPDIGVIHPIHDDAPAAVSWEEFKRTRQAKYTDRTEPNQRGKVLRERLLTLALEECLERDMPMQFHTGDGEAPYVTLRNQHPYYLEELARFDKAGLLRMCRAVCWMKRKRCKQRG